MQDSKQSKFARAKQFVKDYEGPIAFGVGITVGTAIVAKYPTFFLKPDVFYNPAQPIPGVHLDEVALTRSVALGWIGIEFLTEKDLIEEFTEFAGEVVKGAMAIREKTP